MAVLTGYGERPVENLSKKIAIAADHAGFELKKRLSAFLSAEGYEVVGFAAGRVLLR